MKARYILLILLLTGVSSRDLRAQENGKPGLIEKLLRSHTDLFGTVLAEPARYEVQILYTQIDRDRKNNPVFTSHSYRLNADQYFYPASTVKFPAALLALEKLNNLQINGLTKETPLRIDSAYQNQTPMYTDSTAVTGLPSIAHYIKKVLLVSDNDAYNRLYEFVGQKRMNEGLHEKGFTNTRIVTRLSVGSTPEENRYTNPFTFFQNDEVVYQQPLVYNGREFPMPVSSTRKGIGYLRKDELVNEPMDFSHLNYVSLEDLQGILRTCMFPEAVPVQQRFNLREEDYTFLYTYLSMLPRESDYPDYSDTTHYDSYVKFFMYGDTKNPMPPHVRIFNKVGWAYGYLTDNAYIVDFKNNLEFMLSATILVNENQIFNDGEYEYETIGLPFLANLGRVIHEYELRRKRRQPDLSRFRLEYIHANEQVDRR